MNRHQSVDVLVIGNSTLFLEYGPIRLVFGPDRVLGTESASTLQA